jgi:hypothetical protein
VDLQSSPVNATEDCSGPINGGSNLAFQFCKRVFVAVLVVLLPPVVSSAQLPPVESFRLDLTPEEIRDGEAQQTRSVAMQAYLYQLPAFLQMRQVPEFLQGRALLSPDETAIGGWVLVREPSTPKTDNTMPNADTLYGASYVWLDRQGPVVVTLPAVKGRYLMVPKHDTKSHSQLASCRLSISSGRLPCTK